ncbi:MAG: hypothetical protein H6834_09225 [Planctomycetes bacterium]|nr:hypothetical protein [Planctomycetota bacterium]
MQSSERTRRRDVVQDPAAHLVNLEPWPVKPRTVLFALPAPYLAHVFPDPLLERRRRRLDVLRTRFGGGDGPLELVDLETDARPLHIILNELERRGVETLVLEGSKDQPGFARALEGRWETTLVRTEEHALGLPSLLDEVFAGRHASIDCVEDGPPVCDRHACARDEQRLLGPWSGFVPPDACYGTHHAAELRSAWETYWTAHGWPHGVRHAVLGIDPDLERRLAPIESPAPPGSTPRPRLYAITGLDGSGKTTQVQRLARHLGEHGHRVATLKIYRQGGFLELANEISARVRRGAPLANFRLSRIVKLVDSLRVLRDQVLPAAEQHDALVMDRYVETHVAAAASQLDWDLSEHAILRAFPRADLLVLQRLDPDEALRRLEERGEPLTADEHATGLRGYAEAFETLCSRDRALVLDANAPLEDNAAVIARRVDTFLAPRDAATHVPSTPTVNAPAPPRIAHAKSFPVTLGALEPTPRLGSEVLELRAWLAARLASGDPGDEGFWVLAYASQVLLDVLTLPRVDVSLALAPAILARMPSYRDLLALHEIERMLAPRIVIRATCTDPAVLHATFCALGHREPHADRLVREYERVRSEAQPR